MPFHDASSDRRPGLALAALLMLASSTVDADELFGDWRVVDQRMAPWIGGGAQLSAADLPIGTMVELSASGVGGPEVMACAGTSTARLRIPAEGLFQGGLPDPARDVERLGLAVDGGQTLRVDCDNGSWDFHIADRDTLLFALDHRIYSLSRSAGALAASGTPEAAVQHLLELHFDGDMAFMPETWAGKRPALSAALNAAIDGYFAADWPQDEPPPINGDPLTDSQEYPTRFAVRLAVQDSTGAKVPVDFSYPGVSRQVSLRLLRKQGRWLIDDIIGSGGERLVDVLRERP